MRKMSGSKTIPKRGGLLVGDGLKSNEVDFKVDVGPDRETLESIKYFRDAGVIGGLGDNVYKIVLYSLQLLTWVLYNNKQTIAAKDISYYVEQIYEIAKAFEKKQRVLYV